MTEDMITTLMIVSKALNDESDHLNKKSAEAGSQEFKDIYLVASVAMMNAGNRIMSAVFNGENNLRIAEAEARKKK